VSEQRAQALARFFREVSPRLLAEVREREMLPRTPAVEREWTALALHACVRGIAERGGDDVATLVDGFHDEVLAGFGGDSDWRSFLAERYARYDGILRTLGQKGFAESPRAIALACAGAMALDDADSFATTVAPLLEALAAGAAEIGAASPPDGPGTVAPAAPVRAALPPDRLGTVAPAAPVRAASPPDGLGTVAPAAPDTAHDLTLPPMEPLRRLTARLDAAAMPWAVGASALLASLGLVDEVNDWDVQLETSPDELRAVFAGEDFTFHGHGGCHADWKLAFAAARTELIAQFAFFVPGGIVKIPLHMSGSWNGLPMAGIEAWACAYSLMGELDEPVLRERRARRADLLFEHLGRSGAVSAHIEELLEQPLPPRLAARLVGLPRR